MVPNGTVLMVRKVSLMSYLLKLRVRPFSIVTLKVQFAL